MPLDWHAAFTIVAVALATALAFGSVLVLPYFACNVLRVLATCARFVSRFVRTRSVGYVRSVRAYWRDA